MVISSLAGTGNPLDAGRHRGGIFCTNAFTTIGAPVNSVSRCSRCRASSLPYQASLQEELISMASSNADTASLYRSKLPNEAPLLIHESICNGAILIDSS